jgi:hypothetical protein
VGVGAEEEEVDARGLDVRKESQGRGGESGEIWNGELTCLPRSR